MDHSNSLKVFLSLAPLAYARHVMQVTPVNKFYWGIAEAIIQQIVAMPIYGQEALKVVCHPNMNMQKSHHLTLLVICRRVLKHVSKSYVIFRPTLGP